MPKPAVATIHWAAPWMHCSSSIACLLARSLSCRCTPWKKRPSALLVFLRSREGLLLGVLLSWSLSLELAGAAPAILIRLLEETPRPSRLFFLPPSLPFLLATIVPPPQCSKVDCKGVGWIAKKI